MRMNFKRNHLFNPKTYVVECSILQMINTNVHMSLHVLLLNMNDQV